MILGILGNHQKNPNQAVKRGHQRAQVVPQKKRLAWNELNHVCRQKVTIPIIIKRPQSK